MDLQFLNMFTVNRNFKSIATIACVAFLSGATMFGDAKDVYLDQCAVCHGQDGLGKTAKGRKLKVKSVKDTIVKEDETAMIKIVTDGKGTDMDAFKSKLSADQIKAVVEYYRTLAK